MYFLSAENLTICTSFQDFVRTFKSANPLSTPAIGLAVGSAEWRQIDYGARAGSGAVKGLALLLSEAISWQIGLYWAEYSHCFKWMGTKYKYSYCTDAIEYWKLIT